MTLKSALRDVNNAVLDLQSADYNTFERPLQKLSLALEADDLKPMAEKLLSKADFDRFLESASEGGGMMGSARLNWPSDREEELGLVIHLIHRAAKKPHWFSSLAHTYYYSGRKIVASIRKITTAVIIPFNRDFSDYAEEYSSRKQPKEAVQSVGSATSQPTNIEGLPAGGATYVIYNIANMHNSPLQHVAAGGNGVQNNSFSSDDLQAVLELYKARVDELNLDAVQRRRADAQIATIEAQLTDEPDPTIINAAGRSLRTIIEGAIGGAAGNALATAPVWAPLLAMFS